jgi:hypothetical protein
MGRLMATRTGATRPLYVRIPNDVFERLRVQAAARNMTQSLLASVLLTEGLARIGDDPVAVPVQDANTQPLMDRSDVLLTMVVANRNMAESDRTVSVTLSGGTVKGTPIRHRVAITTCYSVPPPVIVFSTLTCGTDNRLS